MPSATATADGHVTKRQKLALAASSTASTALQRQQQRRRHASRLFAPYRTIGLVSPTDVPFSIDPRGKTTFNITTSVGRSLQTYDLRRGLHLLFVTRPQTPGRITAIADFKDHTLAAWSDDGKKSNSGVWMFKRGRKTGELERPPALSRGNRNGNSEPITQLLPLGAWIVGSCSTRVEVWSALTFEHHTTLHVAQGRPRATITGGMCNMPTFLNKILLGTSDGCVEVWNVSTGKHRYTVFPGESDAGAVTALEPAPVLGLFAIAYASGDVVIQDVKADKQVISLRAGSRDAPVSCISFRSDGLGAGQDGQSDGIMATGSKKHGDVTFWDLNNGGRKAGVLRGAHSPPSSSSSSLTKKSGVKDTIPSGGGLTKLAFLSGQPVLVTSGCDNALRTWIFDAQPFAAVPRPLHSRSGHAAPVSRLEFLPANAEGSDADGKWLVSGGLDRSLWGWSLRRDGQSTELSQGAVRKKAKNMGLLNGGGSSGVDGATALEELKAPPVKAIACSLNRDGGIGAMPGTKEVWLIPGKHKSSSTTAESSATGWESVVTAHEGDRFARTWFWGRKKAGRWKFETSDGKDVSAVAVTSCGTFALVGSEGGSVDVWNLQSGSRRGRFPALLTKKQEARLQEKVKAQRDGEMDEDVERYVRGQGKHTKAVTGIQVDALNQVAMTCGADGKLKFWDFHTGHLLHELDWSLTFLLGMRYHRPTDLLALSCDDTSLRIVDTVTKKLVRELWGCEGGIVDFSFSNDGRWIVAISGDAVLRVWDLPTGHLIEAMRFKSKPTAVAFSPTGEYLATAHEDTVGVHVWNNRTLFASVHARRIELDDVVDVDAPVASGENAESALEAAFQEEEEGDDEGAAPSVDQISEKLVTLSLVPKAKWQTLLHLDAIRARNKPKEAPKAPEKAPFFLPSLDKSKPDAAASDALTVATPASKDTKAVASRISTSSEQHTSTFTKHLHSSTPKEAFTHLTTLPPSAADLAIRTLDISPPYTDLTAFVSVLAERLEDKRDYELVQTYMSVFLKCHGDVILESEATMEELKYYRGIQEREVKRLGELVGFCRGVGGWIGGVV